LLRLVDLGEYGPFASVLAVESQSEVGLCLDVDSPRSRLLELQCRPSAISSSFTADWSTSEKGTRENLQISKGERCSSQGWGRWKSAPALPMEPSFEQGDIATTVQ